MTLIYDLLKSRTTSTITTVLTTFTSFGLAAVSTWFASERWAYNRHKGKKWLADVLTDGKNRFYELRGMMITRQALQWSGARMKEAGNSLRRVPSATASFLTAKAEDNETINGTLPFSNKPEDIVLSRQQASEAIQSTSTLDFGPGPRPTSPVSSDGHSDTEYAGSTLEGPAPSSPTGRGRFATAVRHVMMLQAASSGTSLMTPFAPRRQRTTSSNMTGGGADAARKKPALNPSNALRGSRTANLIPKLRTLEPTQDLAAHQALVRHMQFSPDGKFLATSR